MASVLVGHLGHLIAGGDTAPLPYFYFRGYVFGSKVNKKKTFKSLKNDNFEQKITIEFKAPNMM